VNKYVKETNASNELHGVVGPIIGVSGLLLGLAEKRKIPSITLLAETFGHPMYLGIKGAREILKILNKKLDTGINLKDMDKEIKELESEMMKRTEELTEVSRQTAIKKLKSKLGEETSYIG
jgi:proteasome assembly chaperone (PAC2) family protein